MEHKNFLEALNWRYATKQFDTSKKVSESDLNKLLEAARLSASSFGLQPWKFVVISDSKIREKLKAEAWNQPQITDASHLIVLCSRKNINPDYVKKYIEQTAKVRGIPTESLKGFEDTLNGFAQKFSPEGIVEWTKKQTYIALGFLLSAAALKKIDACPMEGFDSAKFDEILGLDDLDLTSAVLCAVGYRSASDSTANFKKVRFDMKDILIKK